MTTEPTRLQSERFYLDTLRASKIHPGHEPTFTSEGYLKEVARVEAVIAGLEAEEAAARQAAVEQRKARQDQFAADAAAALANAPAPSDDT